MTNAPFTLMPKYMVRIKQDLSPIRSRLIQEMGFKLQYQGFLVLPGAFKAPGHLIPCPKNQFPAKRNQISGEFKIPGKLGKQFTRKLKVWHDSHIPDVSCSRISQIRRLLYLVPFSWKRDPWAWDQMPRSLKCPRQCQEAPTMIRLNRA